MTSLELTGHLLLELNQHAIQIVCHNTWIQFHFSSFKALWQFIRFVRTLKRTETPLHLLNSINRSFPCFYYIQNDYIGESNPNLPVSWIGQYVGAPRSNIKFFQLFKHVLS